MNRDTCLAVGGALVVGMAIGYWIAPRASSIPSSTEANPPLAAPPSTTQITAVSNTSSELIASHFNQLSGTEWRAARPKSKANSAEWTAALQVWTRKDPSGAWQWALSQVGPSYVRALSVVVTEWTKQEPRSAIRAALSLPLDQNRVGVLNTGFQQWARMDLDAAIRGARELADTLPDVETTVHSLFKSAAQFDPQQALASLSAITDPVQRSELTVAIISSWSSRDLQAAFASAQQIQDPETRQWALINTYQRWALNNRKEAIAAIEREPNPAIRQRALQDTVSLWFSSEPFAAAKFIAARGDPSLIPKIGGSFVETATYQEVNELLALLPEGKGRDDFIRDAASSAVRRGRYPQAVEFLNRTADSLQRDTQIVQLGFTWNKNQEQTLEPWLQAQPESLDRDLMTLGLVNQRGRTNPSSAVAWLNFIADPSVRLVTCKNLAHQWLMREPAAAQSWLTHHSGLPLEHRQQVIANSHKPLTEYTYDDFLAHRWPTR